MKIFKLPDLGEGLPEAIIREWFIKEGDAVTTDQLMVAVETAKALVEVPAPFDGTVEKLYGQPGDTIETGQPLIGFAGLEDIADDDNIDAGTVVGSIATSERVVTTPPRITPPTTVARQVTRKATAEARSLARKHRIDLNNIPCQSNLITKLDIEQHLKQSSSDTDLKPGYQKLPAARQAMVLSMQHANQQVASMTVHDDVDISVWFKQESLLLRIIRAVCDAVKQEPMLNAHYDPSNMSINLHQDKHHDSTINLGLAIDTPHGLYVPVINDIGNMTNDEILEKIKLYKQQAQQKAINQQDLKGATIVLSNFGSIAGKYATPIVTPPMVAIVGAGRVFEGVLAKDGQVKTAQLLPLSVSADHRVVTGGDIIRFLAALINSLHA